MPFHTFSNQIYFENILDFLFHGLILSDFRLIMAACSLEFRSVLADIDLNSRDTLKILKTLKDCEKVPLSLSKSTQCNP